MNFGLGELIVIGVIVLLVFGAKRLPEVGRSIGEALKGFKEGLNTGNGNNSEEVKGKKGDKKGKS